jgi:hypothetical protein
VTVFFHAIIRRQAIGRGPNTMGTITIYRDADESDRGSGSGIAEPVKRLRLAPGQDPDVLMSMNGWESCGQPTKRGGLVVVPVQPTSWSAKSRVS